MTDVAVSVRGLSGTIDLNVGEGASVADVREAAQLAEGLVLRRNGETISDEANTPVLANDTFVSAPPEAKHGV